MKANDEDDDPVQELCDLAGDIDLEERQTREALLDEADEEIAPDGTTDEWVDKMVALSQAERERLQNSIQPVQMILVKASKNSKMHHLLTASCRFIRLHSKLSIQPLYSSLHGQNVSKT